MQPFFITSSGTDVGKTHLMTTLCWQLKNAGKKVTAIKPVLTGYVPGDNNNDSSRILKSCGISPTPALVEAITPWRYREPLSPNIAAAKENLPDVDFHALVKFCREHTNLTNDILLAEGAGGVMAPINDDKTVLDLIKELKWPVILVVGSYLGTISHTLTAVEVLKNHDISLHALVVNESPKSDVKLEDTVATFEKFISRDTPIIKLPRVEKLEAWQHMPLITWVVES